MSEPMTAEEGEILKEFERGNLLSSANAAEEIDTARRVACNTLNKTRWVNPRLT